MAVRKFKPVTPGQRHKIIGTFEDILHPCQKSLSFTVNVQLVVEITLVR